jgi:hypothetical protein
MLLVEIVEAGGPPVDLGHPGERLNTVVSPRGARRIGHRHHETLGGVDRRVAGDETVQAVHHEERTTEHGDIALGPAGAGHGHVAVRTELCHHLVLLGDEIDLGEQQVPRGLGAQHEFGIDRRAVGLGPAGIDEECLVGEPTGLGHDEFGDLDVRALGHLLGHPGLEDDFDLVWIALTTDRHGISS